MKVLILLVPLLAVVAANPSCDCDFGSRALMCKGLSLTDFHKKDAGCEHAFWKIDLSENSLQEFPDDLQQFQKVNLSLNSLEHLEAAIDQNVQYLDVTKNNIFEINLENKFLSLRHLIAANNHLGVINEFLKGQCRIEHLEVSENKIKTLDAVTICVDLIILDASKNRISQVPKEFVLLTKLQVLHLYENNIKDVSDFPATLQILDLSLNGIVRVRDSSFRGLTSLLALDLTGNSISTLEKHAFATLSSLQSLRLRANDLKFLSSELVKGLKSLKGIDISFNSIVSLPNDTFRDLSVLEKIIMEGNELSTIPALQLGRNVWIVALDRNPFTKMNHSALLTMFSGSRDQRFITLTLNNFRGDDPEWSNVLKYFEGHCSDEYRSLVLKKLTEDLPRYNMYSVALSPCPCAFLRKGDWVVAACIADGAVVNGVPWLEAQEMSAGIKTKGDGRRAKIKRDEF